MATRVRQKMATTGTATATVTETQSIEFVKTILHSSLSNLARARNLFPEKYFDDQGYGLSAGDHSYAQYAAGNLPETEQGTVMQLLRRHRSQRVDELLDWLEKGAFAALEAHNLEFLRINIHADQDHPDNAIETYMFNIRYSPPGGSGNQSIASVDISGPADQSFSIDKANKNVRRLYNKVKLLCDSLPQLPDERYISMEYELVNEVAAQDLPSGFVTNLYPQIHLGTAGGWQRQSQTVEEAPTGSHGTTFHVSYLQEESKPSKRAPAPIPQHLRYSSAANSIADAGDDAYDRLHGNDASPRQISTPSTVVELPAKSSVNSRFGGLESQASAIQDVDNYIQDQRNGTAEYSGQTGNGVSQQDDSLMSSQASNVPAMQAALRNMRQPERMIRGDTQSQRNPRSYSETNEAPYQSDLPLPGEEAESPAAISSEFLLSQQTIAALDANKATLRQGAIELAELRGKKRASELVTCQCESGKEDYDTMIKCGYCNTNQHLHCYGYTDESDLPVTHVCYQCLLGTDEKHILQILRKLARRRRSMHVATQHGVQTQAQFATDLGLPVQDAKPLLQDLKDKGYVIRNGGANKKGKIQFSAAESGPNYESMLEDLFDPLRYIRHHYVRSSDRRRKANSALAQSSDYNAMPPPQTPASRMRHNATIPASRSDRRASMLPFRTPNRYNTLSTQPSKRRLDEDLDDIIFPKRHAGAENGQLWKSARSQRPINANGLSSPAG